MHGANYIGDAPLFPHALHGAASYNPANVYLATRSAARHTRAAGIGWVFAPVMDLPMAARFPRVYESCGEDPTVITALGVAMVQGLQASAPRA
jgi:beta-glucosidase